MGRDKKKLYFGRFIIHLWGNTRIITKKEEKVSLGAFQGAGGFFWYFCGL